MVSMLTEPIEIMSGNCVKLSNTKDGVLLIIDPPSNRLTRRSNVGFVIVFAHSSPVFKQGRNERRGSATHIHIHRLNIFVCNIATRFPVRFPFSFEY